MGGEPRHIEPKRMTQSIMDTEARPPRKGDERPVERVRVSSCRDIEIQA
jgi:hypothetical protein